MYKSNAQYTPSKQRTMSLSRTLNPEYENDLASYNVYASNKVSRQKMQQ